MALFENAYKGTKTFEGGYVSPEVANSIQDAGGETYKGLARNYNKSWRGWVIIDQFKQKYSTPQHFNNVSYYGLKHNTIIANNSLESLHHEHIKKNYWDSLNLSQFNNQSLANYLFDIAYGSGPGIAAKSLQRIIGVTADGKIGKITLQKLNSLNQKLVFDKLKQYRKDWLKNYTGNKSYYKVLEARNESFFFSE